MFFTPVIQNASTTLYHDITEEFSQQSSKSYNDGKYSLAELDNWRTTTLPSVVRSRWESKGVTWLEYDELTLLMDWKLAKGKFRPTLPKLIRSNAPDLVKSATTDGFNIWLKFFTSNKTSSWADINTSDYIDAVKSSFKVVCVLKGVGPATASLILSLLADINALLAPPFFSDESFLYYVVEPTRPDSKIKYNVKEYTEELLPVYFDLMSKVDLNMTTLERGGWALKMYEMYRITKLANVKPKFDVDDDVLLKYCGIDNVEKENENENENESENENRENAPVKTTGRNPKQEVNQDKSGVKRESSTSSGDVNPKTKKVKLE